MDASRRQRLESLAGWSWHPFSDFWEKGFSHLQAFSQREGHCRVPRFYKTDDGYTLGYWVSGERNAKDTMEPDRRQRHARYLKTRYLLGAHARPVTPVGRSVGATGRRMPFK